MSIRVARLLYENYKWLFVGAVVLSDSKVGKDHSLLFRKLSTSAIKKVARGWMRKSSRTYKG